MSTSSPARPILGYTDTETVMLDFDNVLLNTVRYWAMRTMRWFKLKGFIILESSRNNYHVVFDRVVSWTENVKIMTYVVLNTKHPKLTGWFILQCRKQGSTLRVSPKGEKPPPRLVHRHGECKDHLPIFLRYRTMIKTMVRRVAKRSKA